MSYIPSETDSKHTLNLQQSLYDVLQAKPVLTAALVQSIVPKEPLCIGIADKLRSLASVRTSRTTHEDSQRTQAMRTTGYSPVNEIIGRLASRQFLEILGDSQSGKLHHLYQIAVTVTLPKAIWRGIDYQGQGEAIMWIDCGLKFDLPRYIEICLGYIRRIHNAHFAQGSMSDSTLQEREAELLEHSLRRIRLVHPQTPIEVLHTLAHFDTALEATTVFEEAEEWHETDIPTHPTQGIKRGRPEDTNSRHELADQRGNEVLLPIALTDPVSNPRLIILSDIHAFYWERRSVQQGFSFFDAVARLLVQRMQHQGISVIMSSSHVYRKQSGEVTNSLVDPVISSVLGWHPLFSVSEPTASHQSAAPPTTTTTRFQAVPVSSLSSTTSASSPGQDLSGSTISAPELDKTFSPPAYSIFSPRPYRSTFGTGLARLVTHRIYLRSVERVGFEYGNEVDEDRHDVYLAICTGPTGSSETPTGPLRPWSYYFFKIDRLGMFLV